MTEWCVWSQNPLIQKTARGDWDRAERLLYGVMSDATQSVHEPPAAFRIGILDNDACALDCIARLVSSTPIHGRIVDVWSTTSPAVAILECQSGSRHTDVLLIDMALDGVTGPQIATEIHRRAPGIALIGLTSYRLETYRQAAADAGIVTLLDKANLTETLAPALREAAHHAESPRQSSSTASLPSDSPSASSSDLSSAVPDPDTPALSDIERNIIALSMEFLSTKQIGARMGITANTVSSHRRNIKRKLHVGTWLEALEYCRRNHLLSPDAGERDVL